MQSWELRDAERQAAAKRQGVERWNQIIARLDQQYELASAAEGAFMAQCDALRAKMA